MIDQLETVSPEDAGFPGQVVFRAEQGVDDPEVQAAMEELMAGRTTIVIAHRLSTIRGADRILVFENGRVVEEVRHAELVAKGGAYARLHALTEGWV